MNICIVTQQYKNVISGVGLHANNLTNAFLNVGHAITLLLPEDQVPQLSSPQQTIVTVKRPKFNQSQARWISLSFAFNSALSKLEAKNKFDLIHFRMAAFMLALIMIICACEVLKATKEPKKFKIVLGRIFLIGLITAVFILPTLIAGLLSYIEQRDAHSLINQLNKSLTDQAYYKHGDGGTWKLTRKSIPFLTFGFIGVIVGVLSKRNRLFSILIFVWILCLIGFSQLYRLNMPILAFTNVTAVLLIIYLPIGIGSGILWNNLFEETSVKIFEKIRTPIIVLLVLVSTFAFYLRINDFEPRRAFMTASDEAAMKWINLNIDQNAIFGVNTNFVNPVMPYGTDAGYWLPVYAECQTTTLTLLSSLSDDYQWNLERSKIIREFYETNDINQLCEFEIDYLYSGAKTPLGSLDIAELPKLYDNQNLQIIYEQGDVQVFKICNYIFKTMS